MRFCVPTINILQPITGNTGRAPGTGRAMVDYSTERTKVRVKVRARVKEILGLE